MQISRDFAIIILVPLGHVWFYYGCIVLSLTVTLSLPENQLASFSSGFGTGIPLWFLIKHCSPRLVVYLG